MVDDNNINYTQPILYIIIPCYNEEQVLPITSTLFLKKIEELEKIKLVSNKSKILFINDGSQDRTWEIIKALNKENAHFIGICQSKNRGHQNAVLAGLMEAKDRCDITISIDCDGQDDLNAMNKMIQEYCNGNEIVYGVRNNRKSDTFFKWFTAQSYYKLLKKMGADIIYNHADYRLVSSKVLKEFSNFKEINLFLRGLFPLVGFKNTQVFYERHERLAGKSHYTLKKMLALAFNGITSLSVKPLHFITVFGTLIAFLSFIAVLWSILLALLGKSIHGWASITSLISFLGGIQLISIGILGEYIGKIYMEVKQRPRYIISEKIGLEENE